MTSAAIILSHLQTFAMSHATTQIDKTGATILSGSVPVPDLLKELASMKLILPRSTTRTSRHTWPLIEEELNRAIMLSTKTKFANTSSVHDFIKNNPDSFPLTRNVYSRTLKSWVSMYCEKMGWVRWSGNDIRGDKTRGNKKKIYIIPSRE